jgi:hypothetical protein
MSGYENGLRKITTLRGKKNIEKATNKGLHLLIKKVEPFSTVKGKFCIVRNKKTGRETKIYDLRDSRGYSDDFEKVKDWTYQYHIYNFPEEAAYVVPSDIKEDEIVFIDDLIENFLSYTHNQGGSKRLKGCRAIWKNNDLQILYNPDIDCIRAVG